MDIPTEEMIEAGIREIAKLREDAVAEVVIEPASDIHSAGDILTAIYLAMQSRYPAIGDDGVERALQYCDAFLSDGCPPRLIPRVREKIRAAITTLEHPVEGK